jgi:tetratricopeptide (TPR) repeat protein
MALLPRAILPAIARPIRRFRQAPPPVPAHRYVPGRLAVPVLAFAALAAFLGQPAPAQDIQRPTTVPIPLSPAEEITKLMNAGDHAAALKRADEFLVEKPRDLQVRFLRALILSDQKKTDEAVAAFEALTRDFPELPEPYNNLAVLYAAQGRLEEARGLLRQALVAQPNYITAQENLGDLYVSLAAEAYQRVLKLDPNNRPAQAKLALTREIGAKLRAVR